MILFLVIASRDITRPFFGIHGYAQAHAAWAARVHVRYGLSYTHGLPTFAVGDPPAKDPARYLDHPPLPMLLDAAAMWVLGVNEWSLRVEALLVYVASIPFLLLLLRRLIGDAGAILAVLFFVLLPVTGYFHSLTWICWTLPAAIATWWSYLALIGDLGELRRSRGFHVRTLSIALFFIVQVDWPGFLHAGAIGLHYVARCIARRKPPERDVLAVLVVMPVSSLCLVLLVLLSSGGWDVDRLVGLYRFRASAMATPERTLLGWLARQWEVMQADFTLPVLALVLVFLGIAAFRAIVRAGAMQCQVLWPGTRRFPDAWIFYGPALLNLVVFAEAFWAHEFQYLPFAVPVSIAATLGILSTYDVLVARNGLVANVLVVGLIGLVAAFCAQGLNNYYDGRHMSPVTLAWMQKVQNELPPDRPLLSFNSYVLKESPYKAAFYRPEIAWHLDRRIVSVRTLGEVNRLAATGEYWFYLVDVPPAPESLVAELRQRYPYESQPAHFFERGPPLRSYWPAQYLFDLRHPRRLTAESVSSADDQSRLMKLGLEALYGAGDPLKAAAIFGAVLALNPRHYGATRQLAEALDRAGRAREAAEQWKRFLTMAEASHDEANAAVARARLRDRR